MKFVYPYTILLTLKSLKADSSEELYCTGDCAEAISRTIQNNGGEAVDVVEIPAGTQQGRSSGNKSNRDRYLMTTKQERIFSAIAAPTETQGPTGRFGLTFKIPVVNNYGCWCYGGSSWPGARDQTGFGPSVDVYDDACKAHHMGFDCITLDAAAEGESCSPTTEQYSLLVTPLASGDYTLECADEIADDWCKRRTCMVDLRFIARHWKLERDGVHPDYVEYGHKGHHSNVGDFDTSVCAVKVHHGPGNGSNQPIVKVCCGDYPYRIWYNKNNNKGIDCCSYEDPAVTHDYGFSLKVGKLYSTVSATCCSTGVISGSNVC